MPAIMQMCDFCGTTSARQLCDRCLMLCYGPRGRKDGVAVGAGARSPVGTIASGTRIRDHVSNGRSVRAPGGVEVGAGARLPVEPDEVLSHDTSAVRLIADATCDAARTVYPFHP